MIELGGKKLCENCFEEITSQPCPHCGFDPAIPSADPTVLAPGCILLGKYIIGRTIGKGGFGITYLAYDTTLGKKVAIKEFYPYGLALRTAGNPTVAVTTEDNANVFKAGAEKFYEEAKLVSRFNGNPNIVAVHEFFYENDTVYFAMEYLSGHTLKDHIQKQGTLNPGQALFIAQNVSNALMVAHSASVLHRDISPDNIMLCSNGEVKIIDFGAARQVMAERSQTFSVILKPGFAPLEQYQKKGKQGAWTDIYSLGATLYYALTGEIPDDPMSRQEEDLTFGENKYGVNEELWDIIVRATMLKISDRYQDIFELRRALDKVSFAPELIVTPTEQDSAPKENFRTAMPFGTSTASTSSTASTATMQRTQPAQQEVPVRTAEAAVQEKSAGFFAAHKKPLIAAAGGTAAVAAAAVIIAVALNSGGGQPSGGMIHDPEYVQSSFDPLGDSNYSSLPDKTTAATTHSSATGTSPVEFDTSEPEKITSEPEVSTPKPATTTTTKSTPKPEPEPEVTTSKPATTTTTKSTPKDEPKPVTTTTTKSTPKEEPKPVTTTTTKSTSKDEPKPVTTTTTTAKPVVSKPEEVKEVTICGQTYSTDATSLYLSKKFFSDSDIEALKHMKNVTWLELDESNITDISFVKEMPKLRHLDIPKTKVSDISAVKGLTNLHELNISETSVSDISAVKGLTNLELLDVCETKVSDISAVKGLTNLSNFRADKTAISDISVLKGKKSLGIVSISETKVTDLSPLSNCTYMLFLNFNKCKISDISAVKGMKKYLLKIEANDTLVSDLSALKGNTSIWYVEFNNTKVTDPSPLSSCTNLRGISLDGCNIGINLSSLKVKDLRNLELLSLDDCGIYDISPLAGVKKIESLYLGDNTISDVSPLKNCEIESLTLRNNKISETGIDFFEGLTITKVLRLSGNGLTQEQVDRIAAKIKGSPKISI